MQSLLTLLIATLLVAYKYAVLYLSGDEYTNVTGGWKINDHVVKGSAYMTIYGGGSGGYASDQGSVVTAYLLDFSKISTITIRSLRIYDYPSYVYVTSSKSTTVSIYSGKIAQVQLTTNTSYTDTTFDVSGITGTYYLAIISYDAWHNRSSRVTSVKCAK